METLTRLPWAAQSAVFKRLESIADVASLTKQERLKYDEGLRKFRDTLSVLEGARNDGFAEGRANGFAEGRANGFAEGRANGFAEGRAEGHAKGFTEGRAKGEHEKALAIAKKMSLMGISAKDIFEVTGIDVDEEKA